MNSIGNQEPSSASLAKLDDTGDEAKADSPKVDSQLVNQEPAESEETKSPKKLKSASKISRLEQAFDQCPAVLFSFINDFEASQLACALCVPQFLVSKRYDIKRELPLLAVLAGHYPCVVCKVLDQNSGYMDQIPSTVTSLRQIDVSSQFWFEDGLPRSVTDLAMEVGQFQAGPLFPDEKAAPDLKDHWPPQLTSLRFRNIAALSAFPSTLRHLLIYEARSFDFLAGLPLLETLEMERGYGPTVSQLPSTLTSLRTRLPPAFSPEDLQALPASLTRLEVFFCGHNDAAIDDRMTAPFKRAVLRFPPSLLHLSLLRVVCQAIELPPLLQSLHFDAGGEIPLLPEFPPSLQELSFDEQARYEYPLRAPHLRKLVVHEYFPQIRAADFPALTSLTAVHYRHPLEDLPHGLTELLVSRSAHLDSKVEFSKLPRTLKKLELDSEVMDSTDYLPEQLADLTIWSGTFDKPVDHLPRTLTRLNLKAEYAPYAFNQPVERLPESLTELLLPPSFCRPLACLPSALKVLRLDFSDFNHSIDHLPDSLTVLHLSTEFNQPIRSLPRGLTSLALGEKFNQPLPLVAPSNGREPAPRYPILLRSLTLGNDFNQLLALPPSLTSLTLGYAAQFDQWDTFPACLPSGLTSLTLPSLAPKMHDALYDRCPYLWYSVHCG